MAVAHDFSTGPNTVAGFHVTGTSISAAVTGAGVGSGANRVLVVLLTFGSNLSTVPSGLTVTWDSGGTNQAMTQVASASNTAGNGASKSATACFALLNPTSGTKTLAASWTGSREAIAYLNSFTGADQGSVVATCPGASNNDSSVGGSDPGTITITATSSDAMCAIMADDANQSAITFSDTSLDGAWFHSTTTVNTGAQRFVGATHALTFTGVGNFDWAIAGTRIIAVGGVGTVEGSRPGRRPGSLRNKFLVSGPPQRRPQVTEPAAPIVADVEQITTLDAVELEPDEPGLEFVDDGALQPVFADQSEIVALNAEDDFEPEIGLATVDDGALQPVFADQAEIVALPAEDDFEPEAGLDLTLDGALQPVFSDQAEIVALDAQDDFEPETGLDLTQDAAIQAVFADTAEIIVLDAQDDFEPEAGLDLVIGRETDAAAVDTVTVDKADITLAGKAVVEAETIPIGKASISLAGQAVTEALAVAKADITLTGKAVAESETVAVAKADVTLAGKAVAEAETIPIGKADIGVAGKAVAEIDTVAVSKADIGLTGKDVGLVDVANDVAVGPAAITIAGGDVLVSDIGVQGGGGGDRRKRKSARKIIRDEYGNRRVEALKPTRKATVRVSAPATPLPPVAPLTINDEDDETDELLLLLAA